VVGPKTLSKIKFLLLEPIFNKNPTIILYDYPEKYNWSESLDFQAIEDLIIEYERSNYRSKAYLNNGVWTIGYKYTNGVKKGMKITELKAKELLKFEI
jgi:hypothetical protein